MQIGLEVKILGSLIDREIRAKVAVDNLDKMTNMHGHIIGFLRYNSDREIFQRDIEKRFMISGASVSEILKLPPEVKYISRGSQPRFFAMLARALSSSSFAFCPTVCRLDGFP